MEVDILAYAKEIAKKMMEKIRMLVRNERESFIVYLLGLSGFLRFRIVISIYSRECH